MVISDNRKARELKFYGSTTTEAAEPYLNFFIERYAEAYEAEIAAFIAAIRNGGPTQATFDDGYRALMLAEAAVASARTGKKVEVRNIA
jgi:myo-inositol 2-dehydrogenase/D-chiro-inositol 1-dehydrogenase